MIDKPFMQYLRFRVHTETMSEASDEGGTAHCFIKGQTPSNAKYIALGFLRDDGWVRCELLEQAEVGPNDFPGDDAKRYYTQAVQDEEVFVIELPEEHNGEK
jgi:hypothetical protein